MKKKKKLDLTNAHAQQNDLCMSCYGCPSPLNGGIFRTVTTFNSGPGEPGPQ